MRPCPDNLDDFGSAATLAAEPLLGNDPDVVNALYGKVHVLALALAVATIPTASATGYAPDSLVDKKLIYHIDKATGRLSDETGRVVVATYANGKYVDTELWGVTLDEGTYLYRRLGPNEGEVTIHPTNGQYREGDYLEHLYFNTATKGQAEGTLVGGTGTYSGRFSILEGNAPDSLEGKTLTYHIEKGTETFSVDAGRALVVSFSKEHYVDMDVY